MSESTLYQLREDIATLLPLLDFGDDRYFVHQGSLPVMYGAATDRGIGKSFLVLRGFTEFGYSHQGARLWKLDFGQKERSQEEQRRVFATYEYFRVFWETTQEDYESELDYDASSEDN